MFTRRRQAERNTSNRNKNTVSFVPLLVSGRVPSTVFRTITKIAVDSLKGHTHRALPHVGEEIGKVVPSLTNSDSPSTVIFKRFPIGVKASGSHVAPRKISTALVMPFGVSMYRGSDCRGIIFKTPARFSVSVKNAGTRHDNNLSAFTKAFDVSNRSTSLISSFGSLRNNFKPSKCFTDQGYFSRHGIGSINVVTVVGARRNRRSPRNHTDNTLKNNENSYFLG